MRSLRYENDFFYSHANRTHFHEKGFALGLVVKVRVFGTRKWPVSVSRCGWDHDYTIHRLLSPLPLISPPPLCRGRKLISNKPPFLLSRPSLLSLFFTNK